MRELSFHAKYLHTEAAYLPSAAGGSLLQQDNSPGQLDSVGQYSFLPKSAPLTTVKKNPKKQQQRIKLCPNLHKNLCKHQVNREDLVPVPAGWFPRSRAVKLLSRVSCLSKNDIITRD